MAKTTITHSINVDLLKEVEIMRITHNELRSEYINKAIINQLKKDKQKQLKTI
jgi:metal-responsive CopG/Arc/MetJ family transcriptional regulator